MSTISDWAERHRPQGERQLAGNEKARRSIRKWLGSWESGRPKKPGLMLVGPPGVGKTSIARAIANDMDWDVVELNASDARNAAAIRKAATNASTHVSLFSTPGEKSRKTLILLDEVDHLSGGLGKVSEQRIREAIIGSEEKSGTISGDSGGKAELLRLLEETSQPVILACNEEMGLWGRSSRSWRNTRDRFMRHIDLIRFNRASSEALREIANRVLSLEGLAIDDDALQLLLDANPGDIRSLIRDLQVLADVCGGKIDKGSVTSQIALGTRDTSAEVFPGLESLYKARSSQEASSLIRSIDKSPDELVAWMTWNNPNVLNEKSAVRRSSKALVKADQSLPTRFQNTAHRSWYWASHLSALSATSTRVRPPTGRIFCSYPNFMRRGGQGIRSSILERLSKCSGSSGVSVREELLPILRAAQLDDVEQFNMSQRFGFSAEEHAAICGLSPTRRSTKELMERYSESMEQFPEQEDEPSPVIEETTIEQEEQTDSAQRTLF